MIEISIQERDYFLPDDGSIALTEFSNLLKGGYSELWICAYGFTLQPLFASIQAADQNGIKCHILIDHTQEVGHAEAPLVKALAASLKNSDLTVTTAGINSGKPSNIWHWKGLVAKFADGNSALNRFGASPSGVAPVFFNWEGSTNFSASAWTQGNSARIFANDEWAQKFIALQQEHIAWARSNEPQYQIQK